MPRYTYHIINHQGKPETGTLEANSASEVAQELKSACRYILAINQDLFSRLSHRVSTPRLNGIERIMFTDHLSSMIRSGTPLMEALETYIKEEKGQKVILVKSIIQRFSQGQPLSVSLAAFPHTFSPLYQALVNAGEVSGSLEESLAYIATDLRRDHEFHERIKSALLYPAFVLGVAIIVISGLIVFVIPRISEITQSFGTNMPLPTRIVSSIAAWLTTNGTLTIFLVVSTIIALSLALRRQKFKAKMLDALLDVPVIGKVLKRYTISRFLQILGGCIRNGVPLIQSFSLIQGVVGHPRYQAACLRLQQRISKGHSLSAAVTHEPELFSASVGSVIKGGEKTGTLSDALMRLSELYEAEIDRDLKRLTDLIEPVLTVILGIVVAAIALAVIAPIYQITSKIK